MKLLTEKDKSGIPRTNCTEFCLAVLKMICFYHSDRILSANAAHKEKRSQYKNIKTEMNRPYYVPFLCISWVSIVYRSREEELNFKRVLKFILHICLKKLFLWFSSTAAIHKHHNITFILFPEFYQSHCCSGVFSSKWMNNPMLEKLYKLKKGQKIHPLPCTWRYLSLLYVQHSRWEPTLISMFTRSTTQSV